VIFMAISISPEISAAGWFVLHESKKGNMLRIRLRNTRISQADCQQAISNLSKKMFLDGWTLLHHGEVAPVWVALFEKEIR